MNTEADSALPLTHKKTSDQTAQPANATGMGVLALRGGIGGVLMGLANLVPGISGGTMLLAAGVYPRFIEAIGEVTTLKFRRASLVVLCSVVAAALAAIVLLGGPIKDLVLNYRWVMYALFIGLTLGGAPVVWRLVQESKAGNGPAVWAGTAAGFVCMAALAIVQSSGATGEGNNDAFYFLFLAGIAGASAMILPGVSGAYLLLVLGVYVPILSGVDSFKEALFTADVQALIKIGMAVVLPVGLGVVTGIAGVSNLLRWLLQRFEQATLGVLLGFLLGAIVGLWPFQQSITPEEGQTIKGQVVTFGIPATDGDDAAAEATWIFEDSGDPLEAKDLPTEYFSPAVGQVGGAVGLILLGLCTTLLIDRVQGGRKKPSKGSHS